MSQHFWAEDGTSCYKKSLSDRCWCQEFPSQCQQVTKAVHVYARKQDHPND